MKYRKLFLLTLSLMLLSLLLVACGPSREAGFPTGKFIKSGTTNYWLMFTEDGTFSVFNGGVPLVNGTYSVDSGTYTEESNNAGCLDVPRSFKYAFDGTKLTFNYIGDPAEDTCGGRRADFDNVTYTLSK